MMEILGDGFRINKNKQVQGRGKVTQKPPESEGVASSGSVGRAETIDLSSKGRDKANEIQLAQEVVRSAPEVRADKVAQLKKAVQENRFHVSSDALAEKILRDLIIESEFLG